MSDNINDTDPLAKYLRSNSEDDDFNPSPPKTPDDLDLMDYDKEDDMENIPLPLQPRPKENTTHPTGRTARQNRSKESKENTQIDNLWRPK